MPRQRKIIPPIDQSFDEAMNIIANFNPDDDDDLYQAVKKKQEEQEHKDKEEASYYED